MVADAEGLTIRRVALGRIEATYVGDEPTTFELWMDQERLDAANPSEPDAQGQRAVSLAIPAAAINDGVQVLTITRTQDKATLGSVLLIAGAPFDEDLHAQVAQLRAEVDQLKSLLRRRMV